VKGAGSVEYAYARLWARNGERPDEADWHRLEIAREFSALLDTGRALPAISDWISGIAPGGDAHEVEARLRMHWRALVAEVAGWMPDSWQSAVRWCAARIDVPVVQYLARGGTALPWMLRDPVYRDLRFDGPGLAPDLGMLAPLAIEWRRPEAMAAAWRVEWSRRVPRESFADEAPWRDLERAFAAHFRRFDGATIRDGWSLRRALQARLLVLFRKAMLAPAAAFIFLALCALDFERLRGELLRRAAFPRLRLAS
jgi:hypothetical protein